ncbi:MAG: hypothetical protein M3004_01620 [Bacteroidota bacterium]|nr:hypothetical protein [Bacteroidota bacterium]
MKIIYSLLPIFFLIACANNGTEKKETPDTNLNGQNSANATSAAAISASVKILKNGKQVAEYSPSGPAAITLKISGNESMMIKLNSADNVYAILGTLKTPASGNYKLGEGKSDAQFQFLSDGSSKLPTMMNLKGNLQITITAETCSGTFSGTDNVMNEAYEVSGSFTNIPLEKR